MSDAWGVSWGSPSAWGVSWVSSSSSHDGADEEYVRRKLKKIDDRRDEEIALKRGEREHFRAALEVAFDERVLGTKQFEDLREAAAPYVERMESGSITIDWNAVTAKATADMRAMIEAYEAMLDDDDEAMMLL